MTTTVNQIATMRRILQKEGRQKSLGLVPTMGSLHEGHLSLIERAAQECNRVVVSVFVNPLQFGPGEDLDRYPRDLERDVRLAEEAGADWVFAPRVEEMYPSGIRTTVQVSRLTERLCGAHRPGHFDGVATVVSKLFHIIQPDKAYFGLKDAQQVAVIRQMVDDLNFPVQVIPCPTVREEDGLAMSSRNLYLSPKERKLAAVIPQALDDATREREAGRLKTPQEAIKRIRDHMETIPELVIEYVDVLSYPELEPVPSIENRSVIAAVAVRLGHTRLIDNRIWSKEGRR